jgi:hypothetical protein
MGWALARATRGRTPGGWAALAGWCALAYFTFGAPAHVTHMYLAVPFFALAAGIERRFREPFYVLSAVATANLFLFYGISGRPLTPARVWPGVEWDRGPKRGIGTATRRRPTELRSSKFSVDTPSP